MILDMDKVIEMVIVSESIPIPVQAPSAVPGVATELPLNAPPLRSRSRTDTYILQQEAIQTQPNVLLTSVEDPEQPEVANVELKNRTSGMAKLDSGAVQTNKPSNPTPSSSEREIKLKNLVFKHTNASSTSPAAEKFFIALENLYLRNHKPRASVLRRNNSKIFALSRGAKVIEELKHMAAEHHNQNQQLSEDIETEDAEMVVPVEVKKTPFDLAKLLSRSKREMLKTIQKDIMKSEYIMKTLESSKGLSSRLTTTKQARITTISRSNSRENIINIENHKTDLSDKFNPPSTKLNSALKLNSNTERGETSLSPLRLTRNSSSQGPIQPTTTDRSYTKTTKHSSNARNAVIAPHPIPAHRRHRTNYDSSLQGQSSSLASR